MGRKLPVFSATTVIRPPRVENVNAARPWLSIRAIIELAEISLVLVALGGIICELVKIDRDMISTVIFFLAPVGIAVAAALLKRTPGDLRAASVLYLMILSFGNWFALQPKILPAFTGEHPGGSDFASKWNQMSVASRRLGAFDGVTTAVFILFLIGYIAFWMELRRHRHGHSHRLSSATGILGLIVVWGLPAAGAFAAVMSLFS